MMDPRKWLPSMAVIFLALCTLIREGLTIKCYMCNSYRNKFNCENLDKNSEEAHKMIQDCDLLEKAVSGEANYTVCRKLHQTILDRDGNEEVRVIRQCGTQGKLDCHFQSRPKTLQVTSCHCDEDLCNTAASLQSSATAVVALTVAGVVLWMGHRH